MIINPKNSLTLLVDVLSVVLNLPLLLRKLAQDVLEQLGVARRAGVGRSFAVSILHIIIEVNILVCTK